MGIELDDKSRKALVEYRLQRAHETYKDAVRDFENMSLSSSMNRLYYACFYAVLALLVDNGIYAKSHEGVKQMFGKNFIATGILDKEYGRFYSQMLQARIQGDYDDFFTFEVETCENLIKDGKNFIDTIEKHIKSKQ